MTVLQVLDGVAVLLAAVIALPLGAPVAGFLLGAGGWLAFRLVKANEGRLLDRITEDPTRRVGFGLFAAFGRIFLLAGVIVIAGTAGQRRDGLTAALVIFGAYSVAFVIRLITGAQKRGETR
jgi:hypothetical protein